MANGTYNQKHKKVKNKKFLTDPFYDPRDIVQVKYEMLKDAADSNKAIAKIADDFGFSRASFYNIKDTFYKQGLSALVPEKTGPKKPRKLTPSCQEYIDRYIFDNPKSSSNEIAKTLKKNKGVNISKRTVERYRSKKKHY